MTSPLKRSIRENVGNQAALHPPKRERPTNLFVAAVQKIADIIKDFIFPNLKTVEIQAKETQETRNYASAAKWIQTQNHKVASSSPIQNKSPIPKTEKSEPIEAFAKEFIENLIMGYLEITLIETLKIKIASSISTTVQNQADNIQHISKYLIWEDKDLDLSNKKIVNLLTTTIAYLFQSCKSENEKKELIQQALKNSDISPDFANELFRNLCSVKETQTILGDGLAKKFIRELTLLLAPKMIVSEAFLGKLGPAIYKTIQPLVTATVGQRGISPFIKVFVQIGSTLAAERISSLYKKLPLPRLFDEAVAAANLHLIAHIQADKKLKEQPRTNPREFFKSEFSGQRGCHPTTRSLMLLPPDGKVNPILAAYFEGLSKPIIEYIFDKKTVQEFVVGLQTKRQELLEGVENPLAISLIDALVDPSNQDSIITLLEELKPIIGKGLAQGLDTLFIHKLFPKRQFYKILFETVAPPIKGLIHKVLMKKLLQRRLDDSQFMGQLYHAYDQFSKKQNPDLSSILDTLSQDYEKNVRKEQPITIKDKYQEFAKNAVYDLFEELQRMKWSPALGGDMKSALQSIFNAEPSSEKINPYGEIIMNLLFGISEQGMAMRFAKQFRENPTLIKFFREAFLDGIAHIRKADNPNQVLFTLLESVGIKEYSNHSKLTELLQAPATAWTDEEIKNAINVQAEDLALVLKDLLRFVIPGGDNVGGAAVQIGDLLVGLKGQMEVILNELLGTTNLAIYNFGFLTLDVLKKEVEELLKKNEEQI